MKDTIELLMPETRKLIEKAYELGRQDMKRELYNLLECNRSKQLPSSGAKTSVVAASIKVLTQHNRPMTISELLPLVLADGAKITGNTPEANLSSALSRSDKLQSVRFDGRLCWQLK